MTEGVRPTNPSAAQALARHWPEYLIEAWALGLFMIAASLATTLLEYPGAALVHTIGGARLRLFFIGLAMGSTAIGLIYSPWGKRSGAHMNPAVTLAFLSLGRISKSDAAFYIAAQGIGGLVGVWLSAWILGKPFTDSPVLYIATVPGGAGWAVAFVAELSISYLLMFCILVVSNQSRWGRYTGLVAGCLIASYVTFESPLSGMSMNPARTLASAWPGDIWTGLWIYFTAPVAGMWLAARSFKALPAWVERAHHCAKLVHTPGEPCIHCGIR